MMIEMMRIPMRRIFTILFAVLFSGSVAMPAFAESFTKAQKGEMESLVHDYLMEHPEILQEMANKLEAKQKAAETEARMTNLKSHAPELFHDAADAVIGNPKGDVTLVEFMDYNCGWCKKSVKEVQALVAKDKNVRVVLKEFPIFGEGSEYAAKAALAAVKQGKYWQLHQAMFASETKITPEIVDQIATEQGLDVAKMKADMQDPAIAANIQKTQILAQTLLFTGTPAFVVDDQVSPGYVPIDTLQGMLGTVRAGGGCKIC
jgi:protein-disulfide isomerase